jgi:hypothetical protein
MVIMVIRVNKGNDGYLLNIEGCAHLEAENAAHLRDGGLVGDVRRVEPQQL